MKDKDKGCGVVESKGKVGDSKGSKGAKRGVAPEGHGGKRHYMHRRACIEGRAMGRRNRRNELPYSWSTGL